MAWTRHKPDTVNKIQQKLFVISQRKAGSLTYLVLIGRTPIGVFTLTSEGRKRLSAGYLVFQSKSGGGNGKILLHTSLALALERFEGSTLRIGTLKTNKKMLRLMGGLKPSQMKKRVTKYTREVYIILSISNLSSLIQIDMDLDPES
jgi:hypothetical protein